METSDAKAGKVRVKGLVSGSEPQSPGLIWILIPSLSLSLSASPFYRHPAPIRITTGNDANKQGGLKRSPGIANLYSGETVNRKEKVRSLKVHRLMLSLDIL